MGKKDVDLELGGDESGLVEALNRAKAAVLSNTASMRSAFSGVKESLKGIQEQFLAVSAVLAGGSAFKEAIAQTKEITANALSLGRNMGVSATEASKYNVAIEAVGGTTEDFASANQALNRQLKSNEKGLNELGITTRDASGHLRDNKDIMWDAIAAVNSYREGTDRNQAAQIAFGRAANGSSAFLKLSKEAAEEAAKSAEELGLIVGQEDVDAYKENKKATNEALETLKGMGKTIGDAVLPVLTQLAEWFREIGPGSIKIIKGAIGGFVSVFWGLVNVVEIAVDAIKAQFTAMVDTLTHLFDAAYLAMTGQFKKAGAELQAIPKDIKKAWAQGWEEIVADSTKARDKIWNLFADKTPIKETPNAGGGRRMKKPDEDSGERLTLLKNALNAMAQANGDFEQKDIQTYLAYWEAIKANTIGNGKQQVALRAGIEKEILALQKRAHEQEVAMQAEATRQKQEMALGEIEAKRTELQQQLALGNITRRQEVAGELALEEQIFQIRKQALDEQIALAKFDLVAQQKLKDDELKLEQKHSLDVQKIANKEQLEQRKVWTNLFSSIQQGWQGTIQKFLSGSLSIAGAVKGIFQSVTSAVISSLAAMAAKNLTVMAESILLHKTATMEQIKLDAKKAFTGAYQAVVGIPYVGPFLAPAAGAVAYGAVMAFASAKGGYDIPANVNPVTQLHAQEMVLPQPIADPLRQMIKRGNMGGGGMNVSISAIDARSFERALSRGGSGGPLGKALTRMNTRFASRNIIR